MMKRITTPLKRRLTANSAALILAIAALTTTSQSAFAVSAGGDSAAMEAANADSDPADADDSNDPLEPANRYFFELNRFLDTIALKPMATWYRGVVPGVGRNAVRNFLDNLKSPVILANDLLQGEWDRAGTTVERFGINSTVGVLGLFDPADEWGIKQHSEDFGQTLGTYGVNEGPYLYLPVLGPAPPRDLVGFGVDQFFDPLTYIYWNEPKTVPMTRFVVNGIDARSRGLNALDQIERTSVDYYVTIRSLYRQSRRNEIANGRTDVNDLPDIENLNFDTNEPNTPDTQ